MKNLPLSYIEISKENLIHNIKQFRSLLPKDVKIAGVIKANAYGHGDREVAQIISSFVDYLQVDDIEEFERVRKFFKKEIFIFGYLNDDGISRVAKNYRAIITCFDIFHLKKINKIALKLKKNIRIHLAVDSYLGREGILPESIFSFIEELKKSKGVILCGAYSHFANIEDTMNRTHAEKQVNVYHKCVEILKENGFNNLQTHISATSGILTYEGKKELCTKHSIVRLGIGLYGLWPSSHLEFLNKKKIILKPVLRWVTHVAQVKILPANYPVGYGLTYITKKKTKIAVIPQGYSDGLPRYLSNKGKFMIDGKFANIIGRVAMNMIVVDVSSIKNVKEGDEVVVLGSQNKKKITAEDLANVLETINYEAVTSINPFLPRVII